MENKLKDHRFDFLVEMGFDAYEINRQLELWNKETLDSAADEWLRNIYAENIKTLYEKYNSQRFSLYMFFLYSYSFAINNKCFSERLNYVENILGCDYLSKIDDDFWSNGESKIFAYIGVGASEEEWQTKVKDLIEEMNIASSEEDDLVHDSELVESKFNELIDYVITTKNEWQKGNDVNKNLTFAIFKLFDLSDMLNVDLEAEMEKTSKNILNACDYVKERLLDESEKKDGCHE